MDVCIFYAVCLSAHICCLKKKDVLMKLKLNKKKLKNLSNDAQVLPADMTPKVGGGWGGESEEQCNNSVGCDTETCNCPTEMAGCDTPACDTYTATCGAGGHTNFCQTGLCPDDPY